MRPKERVDSIVERKAQGQWTQALIEVGAGPEGLDVSPDGRELWIAHSRDGGVSSIDLEANKAIQLLDAGTKRSNRLKFTADGRHVLISDLGGGEVGGVRCGSA